ncbi:hypothetical protein CKO11_05965, partial [Rhodobacter sp. TJ_12]|nr:hypothetical protein [Rhodobacter sp. TJ_12]
APKPAAAAPAPEPVVEQHRRQQRVLRRRVRTSDLEAAE